MNQICGRWTFALLVATGLLLSATGTTVAQERPIGLDAQEALTLTIYNRDLALVGERRRVDFAAGANRLALLGVSRLLRPETVILGGPGLSLIEQAFEADLLTPRRLLERALGQRIWLRRENPSDGSIAYEEAELVSIAEQPVVRVGGRLEIAFAEEIAFADSGAGLRDQPTLIAELASDTAESKSLSISYLTGGLTWQADYVAELSAAEDRADLTGLVTLVNNSGTAYAEAALRLVAGEINVTGKQMPLMARAEAAGTMAMAAPAPDMAQAPVGEQHLYTLDRKVTLGERETKQVTLLTRAGLPVIKEYRFEELVNAWGGAEEIGPVKAAVVLKIENKESAGLGRPLPAGVVRVYQRLADAAGGPVFIGPVFIGEDAIQHTAEGETLELNTGRAFDVTGRARQTILERLSDKTYDSGQIIMVKNAKDKAIAVKIVGNLPQGWRMMEENLTHEQETANRVVWTLPVPAGGEARLTYRLRVTRP